MASPLEAAIYESDYEHLEQSSPRYLAAIEAELRAGKSPIEIRRTVERSTSPGRGWLALCCHNAAMHIVALGEKAEEDDKMTMKLLGFQPGARRKKQ